VLVIRVSGLRVSVTYTDIHLQRIRFLQALGAEAGIRWEEVRSRQITGLGEADLFYLAFGEFAAVDGGALAAFLERLGSRLVFLIDWNKARKRLGLLVPNETAVAVLGWAAAHDVGHRGFLKLGGERLIYDALEQAVKTPLRYGEPRALRCAASPEPSSSAASSRPPTTRPMSSRMPPFSPASSRRACRPWRCPSPC
jgi:hypothetical protein